MIYSVTISNASGTGASVVVHIKHAVIATVTANTTPLSMSISQTSPVDTAFVDDETKLKVALKLTSGGLFPAPVIKAGIT